MGTAVDSDVGKRVDGVVVGKRVDGVVVGKRVDGLVVGDLVDGCNEIVGVCTGSGAAVENTCNLSNSCRVLNMLY